MSEREGSEGEGSRRKSSASSEPLWLREIAGKSDAFSLVEREHREGDSPKTTSSHRDFKHEYIGHGARRDEGELEKVSAMLARINVGSRERRTPEEFSDPPYAV